MYVYVKFIPLPLWILSRPPSGTILFFDRTKVSIHLVQKQTINSHTPLLLQTKNYRIDGYDWKTRKTNASIREDRMKLKVCGMQVRGS